MGRSNRRVRHGVVVLLFLAAACGGDDDDGGSAAGAAEDGELSGSLTVTGSTSRTTEDSFLALAGAAFEKEHPDVSVTVEGAELDHLSQTLPAQINAGQAPDIISTSTAYGTPISALPLGDAGRVVDLSDEEWVEQLPDTMREQVSVDGRVYSMPTETLYIGMHYNPDLLKTEGLELPETFDDLLALCETADENGVVGVSLSAGEPYLHLDFMIQGLAGAAVYVDDPDFTSNLRDGQTTFAESGWKRVFDQLQEMNETGCFGSDPLAVSRESAEEQFATGDAYTMGSYSLGQERLEPLNPDADFKLVPLPADAADERRVPTGPVVGLVIPETGKNIELAKAFLSFLAENTGELAEQAGGATIPVIVDDPDNPPPLPDYLSELEPFIQDGRVTEIYADQWPSPEVGTAFREGAASIVQGTMEPDEVLEAMDSAWSAAE